MVRVVEIGPTALCIRTGSKMLEERPACSITRVVLMLLAGSVLPDKVEKC